MFAVGLSLIVVGVLLVLVGLALLVRAILQVRALLKTYGVATDIIDPFAKLVEALAKLIGYTGVPQGVPLVVMLLGILLIMVGAGLVAAG